MTTPVHRATGLPATFGPGRSDVSSQPALSNANIPLPTNPVARDESKVPLSLRGHGAEKTPPKSTAQPSDGSRETNALSNQGHGGLSKPSKVSVPQATVVRQEKALANEGHGGLSTPKVPFPQATVVRQENALANEGHGGFSTPKVPVPQVPVVSTPALPRPELNSYPNNPFVPTFPAQPAFHVQQFPVPTVPMHYSDVSVAPKMPIFTPAQPVHVPQVPVNPHFAVVPPQSSLPRQEQRIREAASPKIAEANIAVVPKETARRHNDKPSFSNVEVVPQRVEPTTTFTVQVESPKIASLPGSGQRINPTRQEPVRTKEEPARILTPIDPKVSPDSGFGSFIKMIAVCFTVCIVAVCIFALLPVLL